MKKTQDPFLFLQEKDAKFLDFPSSIFFSRVFVRKKYYYGVLKIGFSSNKSSQNSRDWRFSKSLACNTTNVWMKFACSYSGFVTVFVCSACIWIQHFHRSSVGLFLALDTFAEKRARNRSLALQGDAVLIGQTKFESKVILCWNTFLCSVHSFKLAVW